MDPNNPKQENDNIENIEGANPRDQNSNPEQIQPIMPRKSRLSKSFQRKSRNTLILSILAIAAILFLLFRYGIPLISDASFLFGRVTNTVSNKEQNPTEEKEFVPVPTLDSLPKATNEGGVKVSGGSRSDLTIVIYLNGKQLSEIKPNENGDFEKELTLSEGENIIKAKALKGENESDFSESLTVVLKKEGPELSIDSPSDGAQISGANPIEVKGKSDPDTNILVNDFQAITNSNGEWSYFLTLKDGDNEIKVIATDAASNKTEKIIHVNYSQ